MPDGGGVEENTPVAPRGCGWPCGIDGGLDWNGDDDPDAGALGPSPNILAKSPAGLIGDESGGGGVGKRDGSGGAGAAPGLKKRLNSLLSLSAGFLGAGGSSCVWNMLLKAPRCEGAGCCCGHSSLGGDCGRGVSKSRVNSPGPWAGFDAAGGIGEDVGAACRGAGCGGADSPMGCGGAVWNRRVNSPAA